MKIVITGEQLPDEPVPVAEATVLRIARAYEQATPWHLRRPAVAVAV